MDFKLFMYMLQIQTIDITNRYYTIHHILYKCE